MNSDPTFWLDHGQTRKTTTFKKIYFFTLPKNRLLQMNTITFENFDYTAKPEDLSMVIEMFNEEYNSIIKKVNKAKKYIYDDIELKESCIRYLKDDEFYTMWDDICDKGYIDDDDLEIISDKMYEINHNIWDEPFNEYHELKHLKEKMIYFKRHLSLAEN